MNEENESLEQPSKDCETETASPDSLEMQNLSIAPVKPYFTAITFKDPKTGGLGICINGPGRGGPTGKDKFIPGAIAERNKDNRTKLQKENSAAIHEAAKLSTDALKKSQAEQAAREKARAAEQAKGKAQREALAAKLKKESDDRMKQNQEQDARRAADAKARADAVAAAQDAAAKAKAAAGTKALAGNPVAPLPPAVPQQGTPAMTSAPAVPKAQAGAPVTTPDPADPKAQAGTPAPSATVSNTATDAKASADVTAKVAADDKAKADAAAKTAGEDKDRAEAAAKTAADDKVKADAAVKSAAEAITTADANAKAAADAKIKADAAAKVAAEAKAKADDAVKVAVDAKVKADAAAKVATDDKAKADSVASAATEAKNNADTAASTAADNKTRADAAVKAAADEKIKTDAAAAAAVEAVTKADAAVKAAADAKAKADAAASAAADTQNRADATAKAAEDARAKADAAALASADTKAKTDAAAKATADTQAKSRDALFAKVGVTPAPAYTPEMVKSANTAMAVPGALVLGSTAESMQLSTAGSGVWTVAGDVAGTVTAAIGRGITALAAIAATSTAGAMIAAVTPLFWPTFAGEGSDKVPGRNMEAIFALNAHLLAGNAVKIEPGQTSVAMSVRGNLVENNGQLALQLLKTGKDTLPATVPVLNAVRDAATGLDRITVPAVAGVPSRTILINPVPVPAAPGNTGNQTPVPVTPTHTGSTVKPVDKLVTTTTPVTTTGGLQDFIYWRPDAAGTGVEPVYVMLSSPYGETNARGQYSGRDYNTDKAGGPIQNLDWSTATIDREGVDKVKLHTGRFAESEANKVMIDRLEKILKGAMPATDTDKRFYTHEIRELERYRNLGVKDGAIPDNASEVWNNTHTATLEDYKLSNNEALLYTPEALKAEEEQELRNLK